MSQSLCVLNSRAAESSSSSSGEETKIKDVGKSVPDKKSKPTREKSTGRLFGRTKSAKKQDAKSGSSSSSEDKDKDKISKKPHSALLRKLSFKKKEVKQVASARPTVVEDSSSSENGKDKGDLAAAESSGDKKKHRNHKPNSSQAHDGHTLAGSSSSSTSEGHKHKKGSKVFIPILHY